MTRLLALTFTLLIIAVASGKETGPRYEIWEKEPAPETPVDWDKNPQKFKPYDLAWEQWSYPIGNGHGGANIFGRTTTERIQLSNKGLHNGGHGRVGSFTNFAEVYLDFDHKSVSNYRRSLNLNSAIAEVGYDVQGNRFHREYFASYPDNVIAVKLSSSSPGALSFTIRLEVPFANEPAERTKEDKRTSTRSLDDDLLILSGTEAFFSCNYEAQVKIIQQGGTRKQNLERGSITISNADEVVLLIATGTNYRLNEQVFLNPATTKLDPKLLPHEEVSSRIRAATKIGYGGLKNRHLEDYRNLFDRVSLQLNVSPPEVPTSTLLDQYRKTPDNPWIEQLLFHYGRYLLIASSRPGTLPANLQGAWTQYHWSPWTSGYWHNINVQMNYWGAMSANLAECFEAYSAFFQAYLPRARQYADRYVQQHTPERLASEPGQNGWIVGTGANAYRIGGPGGHSGPGTGGFTSKLFMDYYLFSKDKTYLKEVAYPIIRSLSVFYLKALQPEGELLLVSPSASPEIKATQEQVKDMPGRLDRGNYYVTKGCTFDQAFVWENFQDTLKLADELGMQDPIVDEIRNAITRLDPIQIGASGQVKEFREEVNYGDIGEPHHRHISHLCALYPGTLISSSKKDWMQAASKTLDLRGDRATGWAMAHRMNCRARLGEGDAAQSIYRQFIQERVVPNLWSLHPPFQIDGNLGTMAGVVEMLLQSHEGHIRVLPALPTAWSSGSFEGLVARGNFVVSAKWKDGKAHHLTIASRSGGICQITYPGIGSTQVVDDQGQSITASSSTSDRLEFATTQGKTYAIQF